MVLFGDSHAFMWLPAVLETARRDGWTLVPLIRFGCTPRLWFLSAGADACRAWFRWSLRQIGQLHPDVTLLGGSIGERPSAENVRQPKASSPPRGHSRASAGLS